MSLRPTTADHSATFQTPAGIRRPSRTVMFALLLALAGGGFYVAGNMSTTSASPVNPSKTPDVLELLPRDIALATVQNIQRTIPLTGTIQPLNQTEIMSQQASEIREVLVREGESVRRGQILARLDTADLDARLRDKLGALAVGQAQLALAQKNLRMNSEMLQSNFISQNAFDSVQNGYQVSEATLVSLQAQVSQARKALAETVIRSPINGVVAERMAQPGLAVSANTKLFTVQDLSVMNVEAPVPASDIPAVEIGQQARLKIEGFGDREFIGKVDRINPSTENGSRSIVVHLRVANTEGQLRGGMFAQGSLGVSEAIPTIVIPQDALHEQGQTSHVFLLDKGKLLEQRIRVGIRDASSDVIEVKSGLSLGSQVVVGNISNLRNGQAVRIATPVQGKQT